MPKGIFKRKPLTEEHKKNISKSLMGNTFGKGKNLGNKNALGKVSGDKNGNWNGGTSDIFRVKRQEKIAGRKKSNKCEVCFSFCNTDFDHCHNTGVFRGWLCRRCNLVLGMVKDDSVLLKNLSLYLEVNSGLYRNKSILTNLLENYALPSDDSSSEAK